MLSRGPERMRGAYAADPKASLEVRQPVSGIHSRMAELHALALLVHDAAAEAPPTIHWTRVEQSLFSRVTLEREQDQGIRRDARATEEREGLCGETGRRITTTRLYPQRAVTQVIWTALCAAAAVAWLVQTDSRAVGHTANLSRPGNAADHGRVVRSGDVVTNDASALATAGVIETREAPFSYEVVGLVRIRLAPGSAVHVLPQDAVVCPGGAHPITVALIEGSIHADVVPNPECETFAVEVDQTRIAAHGTAFDVTRENDRALVAVDEGAIAVGPVTHRRTTQGWLVTAPGRASFSLNGATESRWLPPLADASEDRETSHRVDPNWGTQDDARPTLEGAVRDASPSGDQAEAGAESREASSPRGRDDADLDAAARRSRPRPPSPGIGLRGQGRRSTDDAMVQGVVDGIRSCYRKQLAASQLEFSVQSTLTLVIGNNGAVEQGVFRPPLSPTLMACASDPIQAVHFGHSESRWTLKVPIDLTP